MEEYIIKFVVTHEIYDGNVHNVTLKETIIGRGQEESELFDDLGFWLMEHGEKSYREQNRIFDIIWSGLPEIYYESFNPKTKTRYCEQIVLEKV